MSDEFQSIWDENVRDIYCLAKRMKQEKGSRVTRSKLNKLFREGGKVEMALAIYISEAALGKIGGVGALSDLQRRASCERGNWTTVRNRLRSFFKENNSECRWEHVTPVKDCIDQCINKAGGEFDTFQKWFRGEAKNKWAICLILEEEDRRLVGPRDYDKPWEAYTHAGITKHDQAIRSALIDA